MGLAHFLQCNKKQVYLTIEQFLYTKQVTIVEIKAFAMDHKCLKFVFSIVCNKQHQIPIGIEINLAFQITPYEV